MFSEDRKLSIDVTISRFDRRFRSLIIADPIFPYHALRVCMKGEHNLLDLVFCFCFEQVASFDMYFDAATFDAELDFVPFRHALTTCGLSVAAQLALMEQGFVSLDDLALIPCSSLTDLVKTLRTGRAAQPGVVLAPGLEAVPTAPSIAPVNINHLTEFKLISLHAWCCVQDSRGEPLSPEDWNDDTCTYYTTKLRAKLDAPATKSGSTATTTMVKLPPTYTKDTKWTIWYQLFHNFLTTQQGLQSQVPLEYILRPSSDIDANAIYVSDYHRVVGTTPHTGDAYREDNALVWASIKSLTQTSPIYTYIRHLDRTRDGRNAILTLRKRFEGDAFMHQAKQEAYDTMGTTTFSGDRRNWSFENYVNAHTRSHQILEENGEPPAESRKVDAFLRGITSSTAEMAAGKAAILASTEYRNDFAACSSFLSNFVNAAPKAASQRQISASGTAGGRGRGRGGGYQGGRGRGGRGGRGGRDGGGRGTQAKKETRNYTSAEWGDLSQEQRANVMAARAANKLKRSASSVTQQSDEPDDNAENDDEQNAGDRFAASQKRARGS